MPLPVVYAHSAWALELKHARESLAQSRWWRALIDDPEGLWAALEVEDPSTLTTFLAGYDDTDEGRADALAKIRLYQIDVKSFPETPVAVPPRAIIRHMPETRVERNGLAIEQHGVMGILFELEIPERYFNGNRSDHFDNAVLWASNVIGGISRDIDLSSATAGCLAGYIALLQDNGILRLDETAGAWIFQTEMQLTHTGA